MLGRVREIEPTVKQKRNPFLLLQIPQINIFNAFRKFSQIEFLRFAILRDHRALLLCLALAGFRILRLESAFQFVGAKHPREFYRLSLQVLKNILRCFLFGSFENLFQSRQRLLYVLSLVILHILGSFCPPFVYRANQLFFVRIFGFLVLRILAINPVELTYFEIIRKKKLKANSRAFHRDAIHRSTISSR